MSEIAIRVEDLGKRYRVIRPQERHNTLRDVVSHAAAGAARGILRRGRKNAAKDTFWALRNLSFDVRVGEVVGVIGANGAGKSTLLKVLSRITEPSEGEAQIRGRVGSLLEVGTGFHSELTGRENIYLSGAILGMRNHEINRKFDEIVAFAEIDEFIDTPVKHYSSGMHLRLGFAVAAHLEPEILIIDEVLAVGDASFQKKCLGKMGDVAGEGRTVLFVSHNLDAVQRLCSRCIFLERGTLVDEGEPSRVVSTYLSRSGARPAPGSRIDLATVQRRGGGEARFSGVRYSSGEGERGGHPYPFGPLQFDLRIESDAPRTIASLAVSIRSQGGIKLINADTVLQGKTLKLAAGTNSVQLRIPELNLNPGVYSVGFWLATSASGSSVLDWIESAFDLEVIADPRQTWGKTPGSHGIVACRFEVRQEAEKPGFSLVSNL
jgi:lipopolysaccharide transport system ATP-binding protein